MSRDSRSPTAEPSLLPTQPSATTKTTSSAPSAPAVASHPPAKRSVADMKLDIENRLDHATRKDFTNAVNGLMRIGGRKPKSVEPRRQKIRGIVRNNKHVAAVYAEFATAQRAAEKRLTYRLPLVQELEEQDKGGKPSSTAEIEMADRTTLKRFEGMTKIASDGTQIVKELRPIAGSREDTMQFLSMTQSTNDHETNITREFGGLVWDPKRLEGPTTFNKQQTGRATETTYLARSKDTNDGRDGSEDKDDNRIKSAQAEVEDIETEDATQLAAKTIQTQSQTHTPRKIPAMQRFRISGREIAKRSKPSPWSGPPTEHHIYLIPVTNPSAFPTGRIQVVQSQHYPSARIVSMWTHRDSKGGIGQVTADMQDGPVNHLKITDARLVSALGLLHGTNDTIRICTNELRIDETFVIELLPQQRPQDPKAFVVGELTSARHAYLYWLDIRGTADPKCPPYAQEIRRIAVDLVRRAPDVWKEVDGYWQLEQGSGGSVYRKNRLKTLGESPVYGEKESGKKSKIFSMWG
jgi:hypothetical protein